MSGNFIGVDPDMHFVSFWLINGNTNKPICHHSIEIKKKITGRHALIDLAAGIGRSEMFKKFASYGSIDAAACESQELYQFGASKTANPKSIMQLATAAGILLGVLMEYTPCIYFPAPQAWKGNIPKRIHHARICLRAGWKYEAIGDKDGYCVPDVYEQPQCQMRLPSQWKHAIDSIGLAQYARETFMGDSKRAERLA